MKSDGVRLLLMMLCVFLPGLMVAAPAAVGSPLSKDRLLGQDDIPWQISAHVLSYDERTGVIHAEGEVVLTKGDRVLRADRATYEEKTGSARVEGQVHFTIGDDVLTGQSGSFNLKDQTGEIIQGHLFLSHDNYHIRAEKIEKVAERTYLIRQCHVTTCGGEDPDWTITGSEVKITLEGYGTIKHATFRIRDMPLFYLPYFIFPAKTERQTGLLPPGLTHSSRNGYEVELPFFWAMSPNKDATFYQHYMTDRGYMQGLEFRYLAASESRGHFLLDGLSDRKEEKDLNDPEEVELSPLPRSNTTRYWLRGRMDQALPGGLQARLDADVVSDQDYLREFETDLFGFNPRPDLHEVSGRPVEEKFSPTRRSALRISRDGDDYSLQALGSYHQRPENPSEDTTAQPLAGAHFMFLPERTINTPLFFSLESDYDYIWRETGQKGHRLSMAPEIRAPFRVGPYLELEPSFLYTHNSQWVDEMGNQEEHLDRGVYETGMSLLTSLERTYECRWRNATRLKHRVWPSLIYTYRAPAYEEDMEPWFEPIDVESHLNTLAFRLENFLDARLEDKKGGVSYRQWANLTLTQSYDLMEARRDETPEAGKRPFEPLEVLLTLKPFSDLDFFGRADWDHYDHDVVLADFSLDLSVKRSAGKRDRYRIEYRREKGETETLSFSTTIHLAYGFSIGGSLQRSLDVSESVSETFWAEYNRSCWGIQWGVEREDEGTSLLLLFRLRGLGDFKTL